MTASLFSWETSLGALTHQQLEQNKHKNKTCVKTLKLKRQVPYRAFGECYKTATVTTSPNTVMTTEFQLTPDHTSDPLRLWLPLLAGPEQQLCCASATAPGHQGAPVVLPRLTWAPPTAHESQ